MPSSCNDDLGRHSYRTFFFIDNVQRQEDLNFKTFPVKNTQRLHSVQSVGIPGVVKVRSLSCFCREGTGCTCIRGNEWIEIDMKLKTNQQATAAIKTKDGKSTVEKKVKKRGRPRKKKNDDLDHDATNKRQKVDEPKDEKVNENPIDEKGISRKRKNDLLDGGRNQTPEMNGKELEDDKVSHKKNVNDAAKKRQKVIVDEPQEENGSSYQNVNDGSENVIVIDDPNDQNGSPRRRKTKLHDGGKNNEKANEDMHDEDRSKRRKKMQDGENNNEKANDDMHDEDGPKRKKEMQDGGKNNENANYGSDDRAQYFTDAQNALIAKKTFSEFLKKCKQYQAEISQKYPLPEEPSSSDADVDIASLSLYPSDADQTMLPYSIYGDGSCLFRAGSAICFGNEESHHREIRVRVVIEQAISEETYLSNDHLCKGTTLGDRFNLVIRYASETETYHDSVLTPLEMQRHYRLVDCY